MADIATVTTSVSVTLAIQGLYYVIIGFPGQLHRNMAAPSKLQVKENATYFISEMSMSECESALSVYSDWIKQVHGVQIIEGELEYDAEFFRNIMPVLTEKLGRLKGILSSYDYTGSGDLVTEHIVLFDGIRRITKSLAANTLSVSDLDSDLFDLDVIEFKIDTLIHRIQSESRLRDLQAEDDVETTIADTNGMLRRFGIVSFATVFIIVVLGVPAITYLAKLLPNSFALKAWVAAALNGCFVLVVLALLLRETLKNLKNVDRLRISARSRMQNSKQAFERYNEKLNKANTRDQPGQ